MNKPKLMTLKEFMKIDFKTNQGHCPTNKEQNMGLLVTPDFSESQDDIQPGEYAVQITGVEQKTSKAGSPYLRWELSTIGESNPKNNGRKIWHTTMLSGKGAGMLKRLYQVATLNEMPQGAFDTEQLLGRQFKAVVAQGDSGFTEIKTIKAMQ